MKLLLIAIAAFMVVEGKRKKDELSYDESKADIVEDNEKDLFDVFNEDGLNANKVGKSNLFIVSDEVVRKNHEKNEKKIFKKPKKGKFRKQKTEKNKQKKKKRNQNTRNRKRKNEQRLKKHTHPRNKTKRIRKQRLSLNHQKGKHHFDQFDHSHYHKHRRQQNHDHQQLHYQHHTNSKKKLHKSYSKDIYQDHTDTMNNPPINDDYFKDSHIDSYDWAKIAAEKERKCVGIPKNMSLCSNIEYDMMLVPNLLGHDSVEEITQQSSSWTQLLATQCHHSAQIFLCSLYAPVCFDKGIKPCRKLCQEVRRDCEPNMNKNGYVWPKQLHCQQFPSENQVCVSGKMELKSDTTCTECKQLKHKQFLEKFCEADLVVKAKIQTSLVIGEDLKIRTHAKTTRTLKNNELHNLSNDDRQKFNDRNIADTDDKTFWLKAGALCDCEFFETINGIKDEKPLIMLGKIGSKKFNISKFIEKNENITDESKNISTIVETKNANQGRSIGQVDQHGMTNDDVTVTLVMKITKSMNSFVSKLHKIGAENICEEIMRNHKRKYSKHTLRNNEDEDDEESEVINDFNYKKRKTGRKFNRNNILKKRRKQRRNRYGKHSYEE